MRIDALMFEVEPIIVLIESVNYTRMIFFQCDYSLNLVALMFIICIYFNILGQKRRGINVLCSSIIGSMYIKTCLEHDISPLF